MIELTHTSVMNFENAIRGMRNPLQSYEKSDSFCCGNCDPCSHFCRGINCPLFNNMKHISQWEDYEGGMLYVLGKNDLDLAQRLCKAGSDDRKFLRQILVSVDIKAPLYFFKEFSTYKVATVANSTSTMHTIHKKEFTREDFSCEHLARLSVIDGEKSVPDFNFNLFFDSMLFYLNTARKMYLETKDKAYWWQMIQLLPTSYNQLRTCTLNYEVLRNIYHARCHHKLDEWHDFCHWIETLPYAKELIIE